MDMLIWFLIGFLSSVIAVYEWKFLDYFNKCDGKPHQRACYIEAHKSNLQRLSGANIMAIVILTPLGILTMVGSGIFGCFMAMFVVHHYNYEIKKFAKSNIITFKKG